MIFGKRKHKLPETREEYDAAISKGLAAIIQTDITTDIDIDDGPLDGDPLTVLIYDGGFTRVKFPSGRVMEAQCQDVESAIQSSLEAAETSASIAVAHSGSCRFPRIEVHRRPANAKELDWVRSIGMLVRFQRPDGTWAEWE